MKMMLCFQMKLYLPSIHLVTNSCLCIFSQLLFPSQAFTKGRTKGRHLCFLNMHLQMKTIMDTNLKLKTQHQQIQINTTKTKLVRHWHKCLKFKQND